MIKLGEAVELVDDDVDISTQTPDQVLLLHYYGPHNKEVWYRYTAYNGMITLEEFGVIRHTPAGVIVDNYGQPKQCYNASARGFAHKTPEEAWRHLVRRNEFYEYHTRRRLKQVELSNKAIRNLIEQGFKGNAIPEHG